MERKVTEQFESCNILEATIKHNGFKGGDAGHGGYVLISIRNVASSSISVLISPYVTDPAEMDRMALDVNDTAPYLHILLRGDTERETFVDALKFIVGELETYRRLPDESK